jgi:hypothetical protein
MAGLRSMKKGATQTAAQIRKNMMAGDFLYFYSVAPARPAMIMRWASRADIGEPL